MAIIPGSNNSETLTGTNGDDIITGLAGIDGLYGLAGTDSLDGGLDGDYLDGGPGDDIMLGGAGDDHYYVDSAGDEVVEQPGEGTDFVHTSVDFTLPDNVEHMYLTGTADINGTGNTLRNTIRDNAGINILAGGDGDDSYVVQNIGDQVIEQANEGTDYVSSSVSFTLGDNIENLVLKGTAVIDGTGNGLDNRLTGNDLNNALRGGAGNDILDGEFGDDKLYGEAGDDVLNGGLGDNGNILYGGDGNDVLNGTSGADKLHGEGGDDVLKGGVGNDFDDVDGAADTIVEVVGEDFGNIDRVYASASYTLASSVNIRYLATDNIAGVNAINLTGNGFANNIHGNAGDNVLCGMDGKDYLFGYGGADTFFFNSNPVSNSLDTLVDFDGAQDHILLSSAFGTFGPTLDADEFVLGTAAQDANNSIIYDTTTGLLTYDSNGSLSGGVRPFARLSGSPLLDHTDFLLTDFH